MIKIESLKDLRKWNKIPTEEKPYVVEWFYDWFFEELIVKHKFVSAFTAFRVFVEFTEKCEKISSRDAFLRTLKNLEYYSNYSNIWHIKFSVFRSKLLKNCMY